MINEQIKKEILRIINESDNGCGWYIIEMRCRIPRSEFPAGTNIKSYIEEMIEEGKIRRDTDGKREKYTLK